MEKEKSIVHDFEFVGRIIDILRILQNETDEYTTISQSEILELLKKKEHPCSVRTLTDYLKNIMKELNPEDPDGYVKPGVSIEEYKIIANGLEEKLKARDLGLVKEGSKKLQLRKLRYNHLFSFMELDQLIEAVLFLKNIDDTEKDKLIQKLKKLSSNNYPKYSNFLSETTGEISKNMAGIFENSEIDMSVVRKNVNEIRAAIEGVDGIASKICFHFWGYNELGELVLRKHPDGTPREYIVDPYYLILYHGKYYLICSMEPYTTISFYRVDLMSDITRKTKTSMLNEYTKVVEKRRAKRVINGLPMEWNSKTAGKFQTEHLYMFYGEPIKIRLKIHNERYTLLHDYFGNHFKFIKHIDDSWDEVEVRCVPKAIEVWALQCSEYVEIISPESIRKNIADTCKKLMERYNDGIL